MKATRYHYRNMQGLKVIGGTMGDGVDLNQAADRLTGWLDVVVMPSGRLSFAHKGQPVWVYLSVDPAGTDKGKAALKAHNAARRQAEADEQAKQDQLQALVDDIGLDAALARLRGD